MLTYGLTALMALMIVFGVFVDLDEGSSDISDVRVIENSSLETSFDEKNLSLTLKGVTTVSGPNATVSVTSSSYSEEESVLKIVLGGVNQDFSEGASLREIHYSVRVDMASQLPDRVIVQGVSGNIDLFKRESSSGPEV